MALPKLISRLHQTLAPKRFKLSGFTLLELLVAMIVASIVVSGLLYLVVELLKIDRRETVVDQTQRDMQRALDYISDDIREAVYIYSTPSTVANSTQLSDLPAGDPVLAFWRPKPIETGIPVCSTTFAGDPAKLEECNVLRIRQSAYSLVVYLQTKQSNPNWSGKSRIIRYELDKYKKVATLTSTPGYRDPATNGVNFGTWSTSGVTPVGTKYVLVDFVDDPSSPPSFSPSCSSLGAGYTIVPSTAATTNKSFFGCIRDPSSAAASTAGSNQDAYLFLRGNIDGAGGGFGPVGRDSALPTLETRVLMRGVVDKNPAN